MPSNSSPPASGHGPAPPPDAETAASVGVGPDAASVVRATVAPFLVAHRNNDRCYALNFYRCVHNLRAFPAVNYADGGYQEDLANTVGGFRTARALWARSPSILRIEASNWQQGQGGRGPCCYRILRAARREEIVLGAVDAFGLRDTMFLAPERVKESDFVQIGAFEGLEAVALFLSELGDAGHVQAWLRSVVIHLGSAMEGYDPEAEGQDRVVNGFQETTWCFGEEDTNRAEEVIRKALAMMAASVDLKGMAQGVNAK